MAFTGKENGQLCRRDVTEALTAAVKHKAAAAANHRGKSPGWSGVFLGDCTTSLPPDWSHGSFDPVPPLPRQTSKSSYQPFCCFSADLSVNAGRKKRFAQRKTAAVMSLQWLLESAGFKIIDSLFSVAKKIAEGPAEELRVCFKIWLLNFDPLIFCFYRFIFGHVQSFLLSLPVALHSSF